MLTVHPSFVSPTLLLHLEDIDNEALDELDFGVIGFDADGIVRRYNRFEATAAGLARERVAGRSLFTAVAPCMNNGMVAHRFERAAASGEALDATFPYVLTLRLRPVAVRLRLLADPSATHRYVLVERTA